MPDHKQQLALKSKKKLKSMRSRGARGANSNTPENASNIKNIVPVYSFSSTSIISRPNASNGFWLCALLPLAHIMQFVKAPNCAPLPFEAKMLTIAATSMCLETICIYVHLLQNLELFYRLILSFMPGLLSSFAYALITQSSWRFGIFWGFAITFCYQNVYTRVLHGLPRCFTYGEAAVLVQGLLLFLLNCVLQLPLIFAQMRDVVGDFAEMNAIMMSALFYLCIACTLLIYIKQLRHTIGFYMLMLLLLCTVTCVPIDESLPIVTLIEFLFKDTYRLIIIIFYVLLVAVSSFAVWWQQQHTQRASTSRRKCFHLVMVLVYIPGLLYQCAFLYIASGVALAICTVLELFRVLEIPPLTAALKDSFAAFADEKDAGILALTPFCLLIGCSMPIWLSPCPCDGAKLLPLLSGILSIGIGDTAASVYGSKFGRNKWRNTSRSIEGTLAFIAAVLLAVFVLTATNYLQLNTMQWLITLTAIFVTAMVEALTDQIDNLVLPLIFYIIISCV